MQLGVSGGIGLSMGEYPGIKKDLMSNRKMYRIKLTREERETFTQIAKGKRGKLMIAAWKVQRANAMLMCDEGALGPDWTDDKIAEAFGTTTRSLENWRKQAALQGPLSLLERKQRATPPTPPVLNGEKEALLTKIACSTPPDGKSRWTPQMLADELIALEIVDSISLYAAFPAAEAYRLSSRLELVYTPKHGSWLNMAEPELSVMTRQCFSDRVGSQAEVVRRICAWQADRNAHQTGIDWRFTTADARIKLKKLYSIIEMS